MAKENFKIAYFSAEIGISSDLPTYSGGLGVLAGDHIKSSADIELPMVAVSLLYKEGYFKQRIEENGSQVEFYPKFDPLPLLEKINLKFKLKLRNREVWVQSFRYNFEGINGHVVPIYFLDTDLDENHIEDRNISLRLYSGDSDHRILQEALLGFGGMKLLDRLNFSGIETYHMNEGHCSFLTLELYKKYNFDINKVKQKCHFTTHTPVDAGHDQFSKDNVKNILNELLPDQLNLPRLTGENMLHMTELGLHFSRSANGVSKLHGKVAQDQFPDYKIDYITNGVYHPHWMGDSFSLLYDNKLKDWRENPTSLLEIDKISDQELLNAHKLQKQSLLDYVNSQTQQAMSNEILTIGFARRAAEYKRAKLIFRDIERLKSICDQRVQIVFAGKAHPNDSGGKKLIKDVVSNASKLFGNVKIVYLENYNMWLGKLITSGVDVWLNTPLRPNEASGTSGMKAALNGIPNFSIIDGWWAEGCKNEINGWSIGKKETPDDHADSEDLYYVLENKIIPTYYENKENWIEIMRESIKTGVDFTAHKMITNYDKKFYKSN